MDTSPTAAFFVTGGTLGPSSPSYIERATDGQLFQTLLSGQYGYVLSSRQMGKSSLCVRTQNRLEAAGVKCAFLDLTRIGSRNVTPQQWYAGFGLELGRALGLRTEFLEYWKRDDPATPMQRLFGAIEEVALAKISSPIVLFIDEIDATRSLLFDADDFFAGIRECYNRRIQSPEFTRLSFCLLGVAVPSDLVRDARITPFNIGERIELKDFTLAEVAAFGAGLGDRAKLVGRVHYWTGGHPFLTQSICNQVARDTTIRNDAAVDQLVKRDYVDPTARESNINLADVANRVLNLPEAGVELEKHRYEVLSLYESVLRGNAKVRDDESNHLIAVLKLSGIVRVENRFLQPRNRLYATVFGRSWIRENLPGQARERERRAFIRGAIRSGLAGGFVVVAMAALAGMAILQRFRADVAAHDAEQSANEAKTSSERANAVAAAAKLETLQVKRIAGKLDLAAKKASQAATQEKQLRAVAESQTKEALTEKRLANQNANAARSAEGQARARGFEAYVADLHVIARAIEDRQLELARQLLRSQRSSPNRGAAFDYLNRLAENSRESLLRGHRKYVQAVRFGSQGRLLYSASLDGTIRVWGTRSGRFLRSLPGVPAGVRDIALSRDNRTLIGGGQDGTVFADDIRTGKQIWQSSLATNYVNSVAISRDGHYVAACGTAGKVAIWDLTTGAEIKRFNCGEGELSSIDFSPQGRRLAIGSTDKNAYICEVPTGEVRTVLHGHSDGVESVAFSADGEELATSSDDATARIWNPVTATLLRVFVGHTKAVTAVRGSSDSKMWVTASSDGSVMLWEDATGRRLQSLTAPEQFIDATISPDSSEVAAGGTDGLVRVWSVGAGLQLRIAAQSNSARMYSVAESRDGDVVVGGSDDGSVQVLKGRDFTQMHRWSGSSQLPNVAVSPTGNLVAIGSSQSGRTQIWRSSDWQQVTATDGAGPLQFSPDGRTLYVGHYEGYVQVIDALTGKTLRMYSALSEPPIDLAVSRDGSRIVASFESGAAVLWDTASGNQLRVIAPTAGRFTPAAFAPNSSQFALGDQSGAISVFDRGGQPVAVMTGHTGAVEGIAFTPDSKEVVSTGWDSSIRFWDVAKQQELLSLAGNTGQNRRLIVDDAGRVLLCGGDGTLRAIEPFEPSDYKALDAEDHDEDARKAALHNLAIEQLRKAAREIQRSHASSGIAYQAAQAEKSGAWKAAAQLHSRLAALFPENLDYSRLLFGDWCDAGDWAKAHEVAAHLSQSANLDERPGGFQLLALDALHRHDRAAYLAACTSLLKARDPDLLWSTLFVCSMLPDPPSNWAVQFDEMGTARSRGDRADSEQLVALAFWRLRTKQYEEVDRMLKVVDSRGWTDLTAQQRVRANLIWAQADIEQGQIPSGVEHLRAANRLSRPLAQSPDPANRRVIDRILADELRSQTFGLLRARSNGAPKRKSG